MSVAVISLILNSSFYFGVLPFRYKQNRITFIPHIYIFRKILFGFLIILSIRGYNQMLKVVALSGPFSVFSFNVSIFVRISGICFEMFEGVCVTLRRRRIISYLQNLINLQHFDKSTKLLICVRRILVCLVLILLCMISFAIIVPVPHWVVTLNMITFILIGFCTSLWSFSIATFIKLLDQLFLNAEREIQELCLGYIFTQLFKFTHMTATFLKIMGGPIIVSVYMLFLVLTTNIYLIFLQGIGSGFVGLSVISVYNLMGCLMLVMNCSICLQYEKVSNQASMLL